MSIFLASANNFVNEHMVFVVWNDMIWYGVDESWSSLWILQCRINIDPRVSCWICWLLCFQIAWPDRQKQFVFFTHIKISALKNDGPRGPPHTPKTSGWNRREMRKQTKRLFKRLGSVCQLSVGVMRYRQCCCFTQTGRQTTNKELKDHIIRYLSRLRYAFTYLCIVQYLRLLFYDASNITVD